jgi:hypothetical protein
MILTLQDDGVLRVYASAEDAVGDVEALDAEHVFRAVFDDSGVVYSIRWIQPNTRSGLTLKNGVYTLVPTNVKDVPVLRGILQRTTVVEPKGARGQVKELERRLRGTR